MADTHNDPQLDEEELLRSPASDSSGDEMEHDGRMPDKRVEVLRKQVENLGQENTVTVAHDRNANKILSGMVDIDSISPRVLRAYAEQRLRQESRNAIAAGHRATTSGDGDTSALSMFFKCPGRSHRVDMDYRCDCSVTEMLFRDVVPDADETIGKLRFDNVYSLARLISIYECEKSADRKRLRMRDTKYAFITVNGVEKAFTFFKRYCDHVFRSLALHDGSPILLPYSETSEIPIDQLNDLNTQGIKYAMAHDWKDILVKEAVQKVLIFLPDGFRDGQVSEETIEMRTYKRFSEISEVVSQIEPRHIVFVGPTVNKPLHRSSWLKLATTFAKAALAGAKVVVVAPPRGEDAWRQSRIDAREMVEVAKLSAMSMKNNIIGMIPLIESTAEPYQTVGLHPRQSSDETYPEVVVQDFLTALKDYVQSEVAIPKFWETKRATPMKENRERRAEPRVDRVRGGIRKKRGSTRQGPHMVPMMMGPPFQNMLPQFPYMPFPTQQPRGFGRGRRGKGRGGRRL